MMMVRMMGMMKEVQRDMRDVKDEMGQVASVAYQAQATAGEAHKEVTSVKEDISDIKENMVTKGELPKMITEILNWGKRTTRSLSPATCSPLYSVASPVRRQLKMLRSG